MLVPEVPGWNELSIPFPVRVQAWIRDGNSIGCSFLWSLIGAGWGSTSILALFDLSVAFNTIGPWYFSGTTLGVWSGRTTSFLYGHSYLVLIGSERSGPHTRLCRIPQILVLSLLMFNIYMKPLDKIIRHHGLRYQQYADDAQLYVSAQLSDAVTYLSHCLESIKGWLGSNRLKLNHGMMEWLWVWGSLVHRELPSLVLDGFGTAPDRQNV